MGLHPGDRWRGLLLSKSGNCARIGSPISRTTATRRWKSQTKIQHKNVDRGWRGWRIIGIRCNRHSRSDPANHKIEAGFFESR
jgi:hypothetical protein